MSGLMSSVSLSVCDYELKKASDFRKRWFLRLKIEKMYDRDFEAEKKVL